MQAIILAGGKGSRLYPYTAVIPKPLVPVGDIPILEILLRQLKYFGFKQVVIAVGHLASLIKAVFNNGNSLGIKIKYSLEKEPLGTVGPIALIKNLENDFLVMNGDILTSVNFANMMKIHKKKKATMTIGVVDRWQKINSGVLNIKNGEVKRYVEKPIIPYIISGGIYVFNRKVLKYLVAGEYQDLPNLFKILIKAKEKVVAYRIKGSWLDLGNPEDYQKTQEEFQKNRKLYLKQ